MKTKSIILYLCVIITTGSGCGDKSNSEASNKQAAKLPAPSIVGDWKCVSKSGATSDASYSAMNEYSSLSESGTQYVGTYEINGKSLKTIYSNPEYSSSRPTTFEETITTLDAKRLITISKYGTTICDR